MANHKINKKVIDAEVKTLLSKTNYPLNRYNIVKSLHHSFIQIQFSLKRLIKCKEIEIVKYWKRKKLGGKYYFLT